MRLYKFKDGERELGAVWLQHIDGIFIEKNAIDLIITGQRIQILYGNKREAENDYCKITARLEEVSEAAKSFSEMIFIEGGDLQ